MDFAFWDGEWHYPTEGSETAQDDIAWPEMPEAADLSELQEAEGADEAWEEDGEAEAEDGPAEAWNEDVCQEEEEQPQEAEWGQDDEAEGFETAWQDVVEAHGLLPTRAEWEARQAVCLDEAWPEEGAGDPEAAEAWEGEMDDPASTGPDDVCRPPLKKGKSKKASDSPKEEWPTEAQQAELKEWWQKYKSERKPVEACPQLAVSSFMPSCFVMVCNGVCGNPRTMATVMMTNGGTILLGRRLVTCVEYSLRVDMFPKTVSSKQWPGECVFARGKNRNLVGLAVLFRSLSSGSDCCKRSRFYEPGQQLARCVP